MDTENSVKILYTNYRGETGVRKIVPIEILFGATEYHKTPQWMLRAFDIDRQAERHFAISDIKTWF